MKSLSMIQDQILLGEIGVIVVGWLKMSNKHSFPTHHSHCEVNNNRHKSTQSSNKLSTHINPPALTLAGK